MIFDNRTKLERLCDALTKSHDEINAAFEAHAKAEAGAKALWKEYLAEYSARNEPTEIDAEIILVVDGSCIYEIKFDIDEYSQPQVRRVDGYLKIYESER